SSGQDLSVDSYDISFEEVHFAYIDEEKVLDGISFEAKAGTLTALVGPSGSGKTTITALIARFWDVDQGAIRIGGVDLRDMSPQNVYGLISEVFQDVYLFDDTIYENIKIGKPEASEVEIMQAAEKAQLFEFINALPEGLHTKVGEGGNKLSGGQKQRISIARALLKDAPIVLLDEATASLDPENEIYIQRAIQELVQDKTVIVIAHKLASIRQADQILVLNHGKIAESGKHDDLMKQEGLYARFWETQQKTSGWKVQNPKQVVSVPTQEIR
ncbi:MAG: ATP-binding cassette domain-containing protein, partial [Bacteroidota bacterium]